MSEIIQTGFKLAQAVIANGSVTGNEWTDADNLLLVDEDVSESNPGSVASDVTIGNFNSDLPSNAVVTGIEIKIFGYRGAQTSPVITLSPNALDDTSGENVFYPYAPAFEDLTEEYAEYVLGSSTYLFDTTWTVDQINNFKLNLVANGDIYLDAALLNVFYYIPGDDTPPVVDSESCSTCNSPIQAQPFYLALPFSATDTKCYLKSFNYPDGTSIQMSDLGDCGGYVDLVFDEGKPRIQGSNFEENAMCGIWTTLPSGVVELDFVTLENRALAFKTPYTHDADLLSAHDANTKVIISNNAHFYNRFQRTCQVSTPSVYFPAESMSPTITDGSAELEKIETTTNKVNFWMLAFAEGETDENCFFTVRMPDNWNGLPVTFEFLWSSPDGVAEQFVTWGIAGRCCFDQSALDVAYGTRIDTTDAFSGADDLQITPESAEVTPACDADLQGGQWADFRITRVNGAEDNLTGDARLIGVTMRYGIN